MKLQKENVRKKLDDLGFLLLDENKRKNILEQRKLAIKRDYREQYKRENVGNLK